MRFPETLIGELACSEPGAFKIGPFGSSLKKDELVPQGIPVIGIENVVGQKLTKPFRRFITDQKFRELADYQIFPGDILVTTMGTIGKAAVVPPNIEKMIIDSHLFRMRIDKSRVNPDYLCFAINGYTGLLQQLEKQARGAIMDGLNTSILKECVIPLPPLSEQQRIAAILQKADRVRRLRRYARSLSEGYLQSLFLEMFGDLETNPKGWDIVELTDVCKRITDGTHQPPQWVKKGIPFLFVSNIKNGELDFDVEKYISFETWSELNKRCPVEINDILYTIVGSYGNAAIVKTSRPFSFQRHIAHIKPNPQIIHPEFLATMLEAPGVRKQVDTLVRGVAQKTLNLGELAMVKVLVPDKNTVNTFLCIKQKFDHIKSAQIESTRQAEHLFQSLLVRAFSGDL